MSTLAGARDTCQRTGPVRGIMGWSSSISECELRGELLPEGPALPLLRMPTSWGPDIEVEVVVGVEDE